MAYTIEEIKNIAELVSKLKLGKIAVKTKDCELIIEGKKMYCSASCSCSRTGEHDQCDACNTGSGKTV